MDRTFTVLLVEDDPILGEVTVESLSLLGHGITWVTTVGAAFEALRNKHAFEAVLLDLRLGEDHGDSVFEKLQLLRIEYPPVIILSAEPASVIEQAARRVNTLHMLSKPASIAQIDRKLREVCLATPPSEKALGDGEQKDRDPPEAGAIR